MKKHTIKGIGIILLALLPFCAITFLILKDDGKMSFPGKAHGSFIEGPHLVEEDGSRWVEWTVPVYCRNASYESQTAGYISGGKGFWGGRDDGSCVPGNGGYRCRAQLLNEMVDQKGDWVIQVRNYVCPKDAYFNSEALTVHL